MKIARYLAFGITAILAAGAGLYFGERSAPSSSTDLDTGAALLLRQKLPDAQGRQQDFSQWRGKILVVNFWATWCPPCVEEMPELAELQRRYSRQNVQFVGIAIDSGDKIQEFLKKNQNIDYPLLAAGAAGIALGRALGDTSGGLPYTVLIDTDGKVQHVKSGRVRQETVAAWLEAQISRHR